ncbi:MAG: metallophosphatase domain-containing protein [Flavisolibacter sp.]|nr:metallophosphatase domain-containing protein [Flavisolibacter sp.]
MKFVAIADTHGRHHHVKLPPGDVLIHAGDVSFRGRKSEVEDFLDWFSKQKFAHKIFIAGNHDFFFEKEKPVQIKKILPDDVVYLEDSGITIQDIHIWGSPITPRFYNWAFNRARGEAIRKHWDLIPAHTDLLITHGPPKGILDQVMNEQEVGDKDLLERIMTIKPQVHVFGHIHEAFGTNKIGGIRFINASLLNEQYNLVNKPVLFELVAKDLNPS